MTAPQESADQQLRRVRRLVPWDWRDLIIVLGIYAASMQLAIWACGATFDARPKGAAMREADSAASGGETDLRRAHPIVKLLHEDHSISAWLLALLAGVVVAPLAEEFLFRAVFQGWLERVERRVRRRLRAGRKLPAGAVPVTLSSLVFAALHYRVPEEPPAADVLFTILAATTLGNIVAMASMSAYLMLRSGASAAQLGFGRTRLLREIGIGVGALVAIALPLIMLQLALAALLPESVPDPVTLFFFALVLGALYYRTHRLAAPVALHMSLNGVSLLAAWMVTR